MCMGQRVVVDWSTIHFSGERQKEENFMYNFQKGGHNKNEKWTREKNAHLCEKKRLLCTAAPIFLAKFTGHQLSLPLLDAAASSVCGWSDSCWPLFCCCCSKAFSNWSNCAISMLLVLGCVWVAVAAAVIAAAYIFAIIATAWGFCAQELSSWDLLVLLPLTADDGADEPDDRKIDSSRSDAPSWSISFL